MISSDRTAGPAVRWAVIFDLDGLLVDSEPVQMESFNAILARYGVRLDEAAFQPLVGRSTRENFAVLKRRYALAESIEELLLEKARVYDSLLDRGLRVMPGASRLIRRLRRERVPLAVASSSPTRVVRRSLAAAGLNGRVGPIIGGDQVARTKPAPDVYQKAVAVLGLAPSRCVAIEDSEAGVAAALAAGLTCVAVPNRFTSRDVFSGAALVRASLEDLDVEDLRALVIRADRTDNREP